MPDTGELERGSDARAPGDWASAFAALPLDAPGVQGWRRMQARLPATVPASRARWPLWLATAASLALAVAIQMRMQPGNGDAPAGDVAPSPAAQSMDAPEANLDGRALAVEEATPQAAPPAVTAQVPPYTHSARKPSARNGAAPASGRPIRTLAQPETARIAAAEGAPELEPLYAQSAQLEQLLAMARDDRVTSGTVATLTDLLDTEVAQIDAALVQPDLSQQRRSELWGERVDTLRQLVGVEATQRLLAARGQQYDAAMVSID